MPQFIRVALLLAMSSPIIGAYKGGTPPKLAEELAERLQGCQERVLLAYERACAERKQFEKDNQSIMDQHLETLFDSDPKKVAEYRIATEKINAQATQKIVQKHAQDREQCRAKNDLQRLKNT